MDEFVAWLRNEHVADVLAAGADDAEIVKLDVTPELRHAVEIRYRFASRAAFQIYERDDAARLRAEGVTTAARLGVSPGQGVVFTRTTGEILS